MSENDGMMPRRRESCLTTKKSKVLGRIVIRQCVLNRGHVGTKADPKGGHLFPVFTGQVAEQMHEKREKELGSWMRRR